MNVHTGQCSQGDTTLSSSETGRLCPRWRIGNIREHDQETAQADWEGGRLAMGEGWE